MSRTGWGCADTGAFGVVVGVSGRFLGSTAGGRLITRPLGKEETEVCAALTRGRGVVALEGSVFLVAVEDTVVAPCLTSGGDTRTTPFDVVGTAELHATGVTSARVGSTRFGIFGNGLPVGAEVVDWWC